MVEHSRTKMSNKKIEIEYYPTVTLKKETFGKWMHCTFEQKSGETEYYIIHKKCQWAIDQILMGGTYLFEEWN